MLSSASRSDPTPSVLESHRGRLHVERVGLLVRDLDRVAEFYRDVMGLEVIRQVDGMLAMGAGGLELLTLRQDPSAVLQPADMPGLFHTAFLLPARRNLAEWLRHAVQLGAPIEGQSDHLVSEAIYLSDPEGNGIEIYVDRPRSTWAWDGDRVRMATARLDVVDLMREASRPRDERWRMPAGSRIGHVHLCVASLEEAEKMLSSGLGLSPTCRYPGAVFMAEGGYHHHVAANIWRRGARRIREPGYTGIDRITVAIRDGVAQSLQEGPSGIAFETLAAA